MYIDKLNFRNPTTQEKNDINKFWSYEFEKRGKIKKLLLCFHFFG